MDRPVKSLWGCFGLVYLCRWLKQSCSLIIGRPNYLRALGPQNKVTTAPSQRADLEVVMLGLSLDHDRPCTKIIKVHMECSF
jgi:hypothetical protein